MSHPEVKIMDASTAKRTFSWEETPERRLFQNSQKRELAGGGAWGKRSEVTSRGAKEDKHCGAKRGERVRGELLTVSNDKRTKMYPLYLIMGS